MNLISQIHSLPFSVAVSVTIPDNKLSATPQNRRLHTHTSSAALILRPEHIRGGEGEVLKYHNTTPELQTTTSK